MYVFYMMKNFNRFVCARHYQYSLKRLYLIAQNDRASSH